MFSFQFLNPRLVPNYDSYYYGRTPHERDATICYRHPIEYCKDLPPNRLRFLGTWYVTSRCVCIVEQMDAIVCGNGPPFFYFSLIPSSFFFCRTDRFFFWFHLLRFYPANRSLLLHAPCNLKSNHKTITKKQNKKVFNTGTSFSRMVRCCLYQHYCIISVLSFW